MCTKPKKVPKCELTDFDGDQADEISDGRGSSTEDERLENLF